ncbi:hypothetical protein COB55_01920 [Candidatus Wolfebacteria bacterium]|nr:MAG: hypothetical protein COB55_01920 [Candidatus Wolfebacteria bacterium]
MTVGSSVSILNTSISSELFAIFPTISDPPFTRISTPSISTLPSPTVKDIVKVVSLFVHAVTDDPKTVEILGIKVTIGNTFVFIDSSYVTTTSNV